MNTKTEIKNIKETEIEITGEMPTEDFNAYRPAIVKEYADTTTIDGFRKGKAPEKLVVEKVGEDKILLDMAEEAIKEIYPKIIKEKELNVIGRPEVQITKLAKDNPLGFKITTAVLPDIKLPDYKKIAKEVKEKTDQKVEVTEKEIDEVIENIRQSRAETNPPAGGEEKSESAEVDQKEDETNPPAGGENKQPEKPELPELNDEFAKSLGQFESVDDLKNKIKENLTKEKEQKEKERVRVAIVEKVGEKIDMELPEILIENELNKMLAEMRGQVEQMGLKFEDYLSHIKKTEEELRKDWRADASKRVKFGLVMHKISEDAKITPAEDEIEKETEAIMEYYKNAAQKLDRNRVRAHTENMLVNEKVFELLEQA